MRCFAYFLSVALLTAIAAWPQTRTLQRPEPPPPEPYNQLDSNQTLFYVLAAINAGGLR